MGVLPNVLQGLAIGAPLASGMGQAQGIRQQADAQAAAAHYNAQLAREQGSAEASQIRRAGRRELAKQRLRVGASGVRLEGSPLDVIAANAFEIERDAVLAQISGRRTAQLEESQARAAKRAGRTGSASALLGGAIQAGGTALRLNPQWMGGKR